MQAAICDAAGGRGDLLQRMQCSARQKPAESAGDDTDELLSSGRTVQDAESGLSSVQRT
jgi:hypothetical protein